MKTQQLLSASIVCAIAVGMPFGAGAETAAPTDLTSLESRDIAEHRLDRRGDRTSAEQGIDDRLERKGDRIDARLDRKGDRIDRRLDNKGDRVNARLDHKGNRIDRRLDNKGARMNARLDRRGDHRQVTRNSRRETQRREGRQSGHGMQNGGKRKNSRKRRL